MRGSGQLPRLGELLELLPRNVAEGTVGTGRPWWAEEKASAEPSSSDKTTPPRRSDIFGLRSTAKGGPGMARKRRQPTPPDWGPRLLRNEASGPPWIFTELKAAERAELAARARCEKMEGVGDALAGFSAWRIALPRAWFTWLEHRRRYESHMCARLAIELEHGKIRTEGLKGLRHTEARAEAELRAHANVASRHMVSDPLTPVRARLARRRRDEQAGH